MRPNELLRCFSRDVRGGIALIGGLTLPVMVLGAGIAVEYGKLAYRHTQLQKAVDAAAIASTQQLRISNSSDSVVDSVAKQVVVQNAPPIDGTSPDVVTAVNARRDSVQVDASEAVRSAIGRMLTLPSTTISVTATAKISGSAKLCLLTLDPDKNNALYLEKSSRITATGCAIQSNSTNKTGLRADDNAQATAALICSSGGVDNKGLLSPSPTTDCPALTDPLANRPKPSTGLCTGLEKPTVVSSTQSLYPGTYCGGLTISGSAQANLGPGIYVVHNGPLVVQQSAALVGQNVGFYFTGNAGGVRFDPDTTINLTAPKDGDMAGLLFFENRTVSSPVPPPAGPLGSPPAPPLGSTPMRQYRISSNNAPNLLGTIYLPAGRLIIDAKVPVANTSAYTVIVARQLDLNSGPNLYLNTNYGATDIPVPDGVGPKTGNVLLTR